MMIKRSVTLLILATAAVWAWIARAATVDAVVHIGDVAIICEPLTDHADPLNEVEVGTAAEILLARGDDDPIASVDLIIVEHAPDGRLRLRGGLCRVAGR